MKTYTVEGTFTGKIIMQVRAENLEEALNKFDNDEEYEVVLVNPARIKFNPEKIEESK